MSQQIRLDIDHRGVERVLRSPDVQREIGRRADRIAAAAGPGMKSTTYQGRDRVRGQVWTGTDEARKAEADERALTRAIDAGRS